MSLHTSTKPSVKGVLTTIYTGKCTYCGELYAYVEYYPSDVLELNVRYVKHGSCRECDEEVTHLFDPP